jgi:hypothetical protein
MTEATPIYLSEKTMDLSDISRVVDVNGVVVVRTTCDDPKLVSKRAGETD